MTGRVNGTSVLLGLATKCCLINEIADTGLRIRPPNEISRRKLRQRRTFSIVAHFGFPA